MGQPPVFAITGGIGSGKSTVSALLRELGTPVTSADELARLVVEPGTPGLQALEERFGASILQADGRLDRAKLAELTFRDPAARLDLNAIVHPQIQREAERRFAELARVGGLLQGYDIPLLFETGQEGRYTPVVVVSAPQKVRLARAQARDGSSLEALLRRERAQESLESKVRRADFVLDNSGDLAALRAQTVELLRALESFRAA